MRIALLGPPGAGKGSLASLCEERLGLAHLSTGNIFRQEMARHSVLGRRVRRFVTAGRLVPDSLVVQVMVKRLRRLPGRSGIVLDGFPRTVGQARGLESAGTRGPLLDGVVYLETPEPTLVARLSGRRVCARCGANFHIRTMRPRRTGRCDRCGGALIVRNDDRPQTIRRRLAIDRAKAQPLVRYYERRGALRRINGAGRLEQVFERLVRLCRREGWLE